MTSDDTEIVTALRCALAHRLGAKRFAIWFGDQTRWELAGDLLTVYVPSAFHQDFVRRKFRQQAEDVCREALARPLSLTLVVDPSLAQTATASLSVAATNSAGGIGAGGAGNTAGETGGGKSVDKRPAGVQSIIAMGAGQPFASANTSSTNESAKSGTPDVAASAGPDLLDAFVVGQSNQIAFTSTKMVTDSLGQHSPLFIYGPPGVGKTHLAVALRHEVLRRDPRARAIYVTAEQFTTHFCESYRGSGMPMFRKKYRGSQLLIIDDVHFFAGKRATAEELLHTLNAFASDRNQIVLTADRPAGEIAEFPPELMQRLTAGMVARIAPPELKTRIGIAERMAARLELTLAADVIRFVAQHFVSHAREISGALNRLKAFAMAHDQQISLATAELALSDLLQHSNRVVRLADIERAVCGMFGLERESLRVADKSKEISHPRMLAMWLARRHTRAGLSEIGRYFGQRSHSTVAAAQKKVEGWVKDRQAMALKHRNWRVDDVVRRLEEELLTG